MVNEPGATYWMGVLIACIGSFAAGCILTVAYKAKVTVSTGRKLVTMPRWSVIVSSMGATLSELFIANATFRHPTIFNFLALISIVALLLIPGWGVMKQHER